MAETAEEAAEEASEVAEAVVLEEAVAVATGFAAVALTTTVTSKEYTNATSAKHLIIEAATCGLMRPTVTHLAGQSVIDTFPSSAFR